MLSDGKVKEHHSRVAKIPTQSNENVEGWKLMFWGDLHNEILAGTPIDMNGPNYQARQ